MLDVVFRLSGVTKVYEGRKVLDIDRMEIRRGEIFAIVGPSGAGKSTLLRLLNFLEPPTVGTIEFNGRQVSACQCPTLDMRRRVTMVFQRPILLNRSVQANVAYGLKLRGVRSANGPVKEALSLVGLQDLAGQSALTLSGGEAQRVALARAMVFRPDVLLLDEPTANLDPYNVGILEDITRRSNREHGTTIVLVTHNVFQAKRLAHRVGLILNGEIIETSPVEQFYNEPRDQRTRAFLNGDLIY